MLSSLLLASHLALSLAAATPVSFELEGLSPADFRALDGVGLERKVALRLVQEGFAVVAPGGALIRIRAGRQREVMGLEASAGSATAHAQVRIEGVALAEWQLEVVQKASALAHELDVAIPRQTSPPTTVPDSAATEPRQDFALGATLGVVGRAGAWDPLVALGARSGRGPLGLRLTLGAARSSGTGIDLLEAQAALGLGYRFSGRLFELELGVAAGLTLAHFHIDNAWASERDGTLLSPAIWLPIEARWPLGAHAGVVARVAPGLSRAQRHESEGEVLWSRGAARVETSLGADWLF